MIGYEEYVKCFRDYYDKLKSSCDSKEKLQELSDLRKISVEELITEEMVYIDSGTKMLIPEYMDHVKELGVISNTNNKPIFNNRYVFPIKDWHGNIVNLVGYSKDSDERYVYGTGEWYRRRDYIYGLENLKYAYEVGWCILTEGISDAWAVRQFGFKNTFGNCGVEFSEFKKSQLSRLRFGIIQIPDRDRPGLKLLRDTDIGKKVSLFVPIKYKDAAETVEAGYGEDLVSVLKQVSNWVTNEGSLLSVYNEVVNM